MTLNMEVTIMQWTTLLIVVSVSVCFLLFYLFIYLFLSCAAAPRIATHSCRRKMKMMWKGRRLLNTTPDLKDCGPIEITTQVMMT